jgi:ABC-type phosphate transport system ATPase subunit
VDQESTQLTEQAARASRGGVAIAMVTHTPEQAVRLGQRHLRMENRHLVPA